MVIVQGYSINCVKEISIKNIRNDKNFNRDLSFIKNSIFEIISNKVYIPFKIVKNK